MKSFASARRKTEQVVLLALRLGDALVDALALLQQLVDLELELIVALALLARQLPITLARRRRGGEGAGRRRQVYREAGLDPGASQTRTSLSLPCACASWPPCVPRRSVPPPVVRRRPCRRSYRRAATRHVSPACLARSR